VNTNMNMTTLEFPRITPLVPVQPLSPAVPAPRPPVCRDAINRELVLRAQGRGDSGPGRWERWLLAPLIGASLLAMVTAATTGVQWVAQWHLFVQWAQRILA
jgi:hypothetical protein